MGERKVLNKYYPPDFDPAKLPKGKRQERNLMTVRMMLPMSVRCKTCGNFMYKGTKFNTRKEDVEGENYLGIQIFRFYYRCTNCAAEFTMKTDPKSSDYIMEEGASRNYEPWRESDALKAEALRSREDEERGNAMKALENRTKDSKREMDIMEALDEMRSLKARHAGITTEQALVALQQAGAIVRNGAGDGADPVPAAVAAAEPATYRGDELPEEDTSAIRQFLQQQSTVLRRLHSEEESSEEADRAAAGASDPFETTDRAAPLTGAAQGVAPPAAACKHPAIKVAVRAKRRAAAALDDTKKRIPAARQQPDGDAADGSTAAQLLGLVGNYGSSSSSEDYT